MQEGASRQSSGKRRSRLDVRLGRRGESIRGGFFDHEV